MNTIDALFDELTAAQAERKLPPVHLWHPEREGDIDIHIDASGAWFHEGGLIERQPLVDLFATILRREEDDYFLVTPVEKLRIKVDDVPFVATDMDVRGDGKDTELLFTINVGDYVVAGEEHPLSMRHGAPYLLVRDGLEAKLSRNVFYRLVEEGIEEDGALYVYSQGARFNLGRTA